MAAMLNQFQKNLSPRETFARWITGRFQNWEGTDPGYTCHREKGMKKEFMGHLRRF
jgi:hypothetical protein